MKKILLLMMLMMFTLASQADTVCHLSNSGETVQVKNLTVSDNKDCVNVTLINDSHVYANMTVTVEIEYTGFNKRSFSVTDIVAPGTQTISVPIDEKAQLSLSSYANFVRVKEVSISGYKCK